MTSKKRGNCSYQQKYPQSFMTETIFLHIKEHGTDLIIFLKPFLLKVLSLVHDYDVSLLDFL